MKYKNTKNKTIDEIIKFLEMLKEEEDVMSIDFNAPHIVEIGGDYQYTYGRLESDFTIIYTTEYKKANNFIANWEKIKEKGE